MMNFIKKIELHKKSKPIENPDSLNQEKLIEEIKNICREMDKTNLWFQMEENSDLIDACIHQREVLNARYRYLMNKIKFDKIS